MIAYGLRAEYAGTVEQHFPADADHDEPYTVEVPTFTGGVISHGDGNSFNVRDELDAEPYPGIILVEEGATELVLALDGYPALKRLKVPEGAEASSSAYSGLTVTALRAEAKRRGLVGYSGLDKPTLERALIAHDARLAAGDTDAQASPDHAVKVLEDGSLETPADRAGEPGVNADGTTPPEPTDTAGTAGQEN